MSEDRHTEQQDTFTDSRGIPVSYASRAAIDALEHAHESYLAFGGDPLEEANRVIKRHPDFMLAHLFKAGYLTQILETRVFDELASTIAAAEKLLTSANDREHAHLKAVKAWIKGDTSGAVAEWERALDLYPLDLLALQLIHLSNVLLGEIAGQRDVVARVFSLWDETIDGFEFVLGFYAFGLEENGDFDRAERLALDALKLRQDNPYAVHAVCHVMDMQGRSGEGLRIMYDESQTWRESGFSIHLWWHTALLHLDLQDFDRVLEIYDTNLRTSQEHADRYEEYDAAALLWRLNLADVDVGVRWVELADKWEPAAADTLYAFNNVHAMMTFVADGRDDAAQLLLATNKRYVEQSSQANVASIREIGLPACMAVKDFHDERYSECVDRLLPVRYNEYLLGGSFVQRDVIRWTILEAAFRADRKDLALALANECCELKSSSPQRWLDVARAQEGMQNMALAKKAREKAQELLTQHQRALAKT